MPIVLKKCCCGICLRTGSIIIGIYVLINGLFQTTTGSVQYFLPGNQSLNETVDLETYWMSWLNGDTDGPLSICSGLITTIGATILLIGIFKSKPRYILMFIIQESVSTTISSFLVFVSVGYYFFFGDELFAIALLVFGVIDLSLNIYIILVLYNYYNLCAVKLPGAHFTA